MVVSATAMAGRGVRGVRFSSASQWLLPARQSLTKATGPSRSSIRHMNHRRPRSAWANRRSDESRNDTQKKSDKKNLH